MIGGAGIMGGGERMILTIVVLADTGAVRHVPGKAAEGRRSPRRKAFAHDSRTARSVLDCASPLALYTVTKAFGSSS
jgi:hypothetical protein